MPHGFLVWFAGVYFLVCFTLDAGVWFWSWLQIDVSGVLGGYVDLGTLGFFVC